MQIEITVNGERARGVEANLHWDMRSVSPSGYVRANGVTYDIAYEHDYFDQDGNRVREFVTTSRERLVMTIYVAKDKVEL